MLNIPLSFPSGGKFSRGVKANQKGTGAEKQREKTINVAKRRRNVSIQAQSEIILP